MTRLATGIQGFDAMVQGGLPLGSSVVFQGPPGREKLRFALTFLAEGLKAGASGLVVISSDSPDAVLAELRSLGVNLDTVAAEQRLRIVDWYSWSEETVADVEERGIIVRSSIDLTNLGVALSRAMAALSNRQSPRAVIDMLSPATNVYDVTQVYAFAQSAKKKFDRFGFTSLVVLEKDMHSASQLSTLHQPFDGVIEFERTRSGDRIQRKVGVLHLKGTTADPTFRTLELTEAGMRVVRESATPSPSSAIPSGTVLESQEERARRLTLIMQIAGERLKLNPRDADALFAMAAAQATLDDPRGGLQSLERLAELDPNYPGLWVLKTKLHARLGEAERAQESRRRGQKAEAAEDRSVPPTVPCPMCESPVGVDATTCGNCGVKFSLAAKLEDELDDLGRAAIQDMVLEEGGPRPPPKQSERKTLEPPSKLPSKKGLTNGLVLERGPRRPTGRTNGLKSRTNGLRGRTNGLTNGLRGRTNGLTNGVGRTNGLTNGLGRTNGLTNGLGRTNGLTNGLGRTNGITNGLGRTNGLTNGLGGRRASGFRSSGFRGMMQTAGWKLYVIPLFVVGLLLMPLFFVPEYQGPSTPIRIDGQFGDWASVSTAAMGSGTISNPNVDIVRFGVTDNLGPQAFYVQVAGTALQGGGASPGTMDSVRIFVDTDGASTTGYRIDGLGAERLIDVSGYAGVVRSSSLWEFDANRDVRDWAGWIKGTSTAAAASGSQIEAEAEWLDSETSIRPFAAVAHTASWDGETDIGDVPVGPGSGSLTVVADPLVPAVISGTEVPLLRLTVRGHVGSVALDSVHVEIVGTAPPTSASSLRLRDGAAVLSQVTPTGRDATFSFPTMSIGEGATTTLSITGDFTGTGGETFGVRLPNGHPFGLNATAVGLRDNAGSRLVGYLGSIPGTPQVDGGFDEWGAARSDAAGDVGPRPNPNIDIEREGARSAGGSTYLYADVTGRILRGTPVPEAPRPAPVQRPPADTDRDTVPDGLDPLPLDFNNDGIPDAQTNGDYDGDGILDYGVSGGTDSWLNTTLPSNFPPPYGRRSVTVYIGPTERPPTLGADVLRFFLDGDNSSATGYVIGGIGADRQVELRGKDGAVTQSALLAFAGSFPGEWRWSPLLPVTVATGHHAVETSVSFAVANLHVESGDYWGSADSTISGPAYAFRSSFEVSAAHKSLPVPWMQVGPQASGTLIDPGSNSASTVYNHQRKVVRAGDVSGDTACDATNSDGCWYAVFYDHLVETTLAAPFAETITTGTKVAGMFPTDVNTSNNVYLQYREANTGGQAPTLESGWTSNTAVPGASLTLTKPADVGVGDLLLIIVGSDDNTDTDQWDNSALKPTGFTLINEAGDAATSDAHVGAFWRIADGSETATIDVPAQSDQDYWGFYVRVTGAHQTAPINIAGSDVVDSTDPYDVAGVTTTVNNALAFYVLAFDGGDFGAFSVAGTGWSQSAEVQAGTGSGNAGGTWGTKVQASPGSTGTASVSSSTNDDSTASFQFAVAPASTNYKLQVRYDWSGLPVGASSNELRVEAHHTSGEDVLVQVLTPPSTWNTRITITKTSDDDAAQTYPLTASEFNAGAPSIRFVGGKEGGDTAQSDLWVDRTIIDTTNGWDRIIAMRSLDTSGSSWGSQVILASGRSSDGALLLARDSAEPSIAIDSSGFLHVVWVSASASGDQTLLNLVRYSKTTVAYPTQAELTSTSFWDPAVTSVDDANPGFMPTVSTDTSDNPHIAWSASKTTGMAHYKNKAGGTWRSTVSWGNSYAGVSVDVSPQNNYVSLAGYYQNPLEQADVAYRSSTGSNTINSPKTRTWDGSSWGGEAEQATAGSPIRVVRMAWSPIEANTRIVVTESDDGWLDAYVCTPTCSATNNIGQVWSSAPGTAQARFDVAYEQVSGTALLAYHKQGGSGAQDIAYKTYAAGSWSTEQYLDDPDHPSHAEYFLIKLASKEGSDQIGMVGAELTNTDVNAWIWDGNVFGNFQNITVSAGATDGDNADIAWESNSGHLLAVATTTGTDIVSKEFTTTWGPSVTFACISASTTMRYPRLKANPLATADDMVLAVVGNFNLNTCYWSGSGWSNRVSHDSAVHQTLYRVFDFAWETTGSKGLLVYSGTDFQITYRTFTAATQLWGPITDVPMGTSSNDLWVQARTNPFPQATSTKVLGAVIENGGSGIGAFRWNGSAFTVIGASAIAASTGGFAGNEMFDLKYREVDVGGTAEIHHMVCKTLSPPTNLCDAPGAFTKWDGTPGIDAVASVASIATVQSITTTSFPTDSTTHNVQMPATVNAGDLLVAFIATDGTPNVATPSGWTWFFGWDGWGGATNKFSMFAKKAAGTEDGTTVDFQTTVAEKAAAHVYRITGWRDSGTLTNDIEWSNAGATSANPNPPSLNPATWDVESTLWIVAYGADGDQDASAYPALYVDGAYTQSDNSATSASMGSAWRSAVTASEDPGTFTVAASEFWIASTVAVRSSEPRYPSLATTYDAGGDLWVAYDKDVSGTTRAVHARLLDYPSGWQTQTTIDFLDGTIFTKPSIGIDRNNDVHALYVKAAGPQLYYSRRTGGTWGPPEPVDTSSTHPTLVVRAPNDAIYGNVLGGLYWRETTSETYFYIPEFEEIVVPILSTLLIIGVCRRRLRRRGSASSTQQRAEDLAVSGAPPVPS